MAQKDEAIDRRAVRTKPIDAKLFKLHAAFDKHVTVGPSYPLYRVAHAVIRQCTCGAWFYCQSDTGRMAPLWGPHEIAAGIKIRPLLRKPLKRYVQVLKPLDGAYSPVKWAKVLGQLKDMES